MIVDSLDVVYRNLLSALETFKARLITQLHSASITLDWRIEEAAFQNTTLENSEVLNVYRFFLEAIANERQRAQARSVKIYGNVDIDSVILFCDQLRPN